ncbi:MAG TPA: hypothetical protein VML55_06700 [Planctomycetaceae bacterium]|nr:hypothetical protein [Planctomycetaceae bacterium]
MNPIFLDTNAYTAYKRGDPEALAIVQQAPALSTNAVVLGELFAGFASGTRDAANRHELDQFFAVANAAVLFVDRGTAELDSSIYMQHSQVCPARQAGHTRPTDARGAARLTVCRPTCRVEV